MLTEAENEEIVREARFLQKLKHPNIAEFIGMELNKKTLIDQIEQIDHVRQGVLSFLFFIVAFLLFAFIFFISALSSRKYGDKAAADFIYMLRYTKQTKF